MPTCLVHNCETSQGLVDFYLLSPLFQDQIPFDPHQRPSLKLSHRRLGPFEIKHQVGPLAYCLKLPHRIRQLHQVFNIVKLSTALEDPIPERKLQAPLLPIVVDKEPEWEVKEILDSRWHWRRF